MKPDLESSRNEISELKLSSMKSILKHGAKGRQTTQESKFRTIRYNSPAMSLGAFLKFIKEVPKSFPRVRFRIGEKDKLYTNLTTLSHQQQD